MISKLKREKSAAGSDGICAESALLCLCVSLFFVHGYIPSVTTETCIITIVKNNCSKISDCNNYRPISSANIILKVF